MAKTVANISYGEGGNFFYPETPVKDFKSQAWIRFFIRICEDLIFGVFFYPVSQILVQKVFEGDLSCDGICTKLKF